MDGGLKFVDVVVGLRCAVIEYGECFDNVLIWSSVRLAGGE